MFDPGSMDLSALLAQAQELQDQFERAQEELGNQRVTGSAGGGLIEASVSGVGEMVGLTITPEAIESTDPETLADLVVAAVRDANNKAMTLAQATMPSMPELDD